MKNHYKIHQEQYASNCLEYDQNLMFNEDGTVNDDDDEGEMLSVQRPLPGVTDPAANGVVIFSDMLDWLKSDFEELDLKEQILKEDIKKKQMR